jgi:hypothetical protein
MSDFAYKHGLCQWFEEDGAELIHPDDIERFRQLMPSARVFHCDGVEGEYLVLAYGEHRFRVKRSLFRPVDRPARAIGESVSLMTKGNLVHGVITDIVWHFQRAEPYYHVTANGKELKKRYWKDDFIVSS